MDTNYRPPQVQNTTILLALVGTLDIFLGYQSIQLSLIIRNPIQSIIGTLMIAFGFLTFLASLIVWLQKSWVTKIIAGVGIAYCGFLIIFGYYTITIIVFAPLYWLGIHWVRKGQSTETLDWAPSWNED